MALPYTQNRWEDFRNQTELYLVICHKKADKNPSQVSHFNFSFAIAEWEEGPRDCLEAV